MLKYVLISSAAMLLVSACQTSPDAGRTGFGNASSDRVPAINTVPDAGLEAQELAPGECGLFLWSQTDVSKFIFFSKALSGEAVMAQAKGQTRLQQIGAGGDIFGQFNTQMQYAAKRPEQTVELVLTPGELLEGGQRLESGILTAQGVEGWQTKLPVLGVRACQRGG